jgi:predicted metal-binding protein
MHRNPERFRLEDVVMEDTVWKCKCGHIEYGKFPPEDCPKCLRVNKFLKVPEDMVEELEDEEVLSLMEEEYEED